MPSTAPRGQIVQAGFFTLKRGLRGVHDEQAEVVEKNSSPRMLGHTEADDIFCQFSLLRAVILGL